MDGPKPCSRRVLLQTAIGTAWTATPFGRAAVLAAFAPDSSIRFGVIADCQYADAPSTGTRFYRRSLEKLRRAVDEMNSRDLDFVIHLGDFIDRDFTSFDRVLPIFQGCRAPTYHVLGNHDFAVADALKARVPEKLDLPQTYYQFACRGWRLIVLDGNDVSLQAHGKGSPAYRAAARMLERLQATKAPNAQSWNGALGRVQLDWLEAALDQADQAGERAIVFCHFPVYPPSEHNLWNANDVMEILQRHASVVAYLCGHNHAGNYAMKDGIHYVTMPGMVETPNTTAYAVIRAAAHQLVIDGRGRVNRRELTLRASDVPSQ